MAIADVEITVLSKMDFEGEIELVLREVETMGQRFCDLRLRDVRSGKWGNGITLPVGRIEELVTALKEIEP